MSTRAPDVLNDDEPPPSTQPVLDSKQLRKIACECFEAVSCSSNGGQAWLVDPKASAAFDAEM